MAFATPAHSTTSSNENDDDTTVISDPGSDTTGGDLGQVRPR